MFVRLGENKARWPDADDTEPNALEEDQAGKATPEGRPGEPARARTAAIDLRAGGREQNSAEEVSCYWTRARASESLPSTLSTLPGDPESVREGAIRWTGCAIWVEAVITEADSVPAGVTRSRMPAYRWNQTLEGRGGDSRPRSRPCRRAGCEWMQYALVLLSQQLGENSCCGPLVRGSLWQPMRLHDPRARDTHTAEPTPLLGGWPCTAPDSGGLLLVESRLGSSRDPFPDAGSRTQSGPAAGGRPPWIVRRRLHPMTGGG